MLSNTLTLKNTAGADQSFVKTTVRPELSMYTRSTSTAASLDVLEFRKGQSYSKGTKITSETRSISASHVEVQTVNTVPGISAGVLALFQLKYANLAEITTAEIKETVNYFLRYVTADNTVSISDSVLASLMLGEL
jgi:D-mannonate dehydratase